MVCRLLPAERTMAYPRYLQAIPMILSRRQALFGLAAIAAPAVIRTPGILMPIKSALLDEEFPEQLRDPVSVQELANWLSVELEHSMLECLRYHPSGELRNSPYEGMADRFKKHFQDRPIVRPFDKELALFGLGQRVDLTRESI